jgi:hypothetical protein
MTETDGITTEAPVLSMEAQARACEALDRGATIRQAIEVAGVAFGGPTGKTYRHELALNGYTWAASADEARCWMRGLSREGV